MTKMNDKDSFTKAFCGIRERMTAVRLGYRNNQQQIIANQENTIRQFQWTNQQILAKNDSQERIGPLFVWT